MTTTTAYPASYGHLMRGRYGDLLTADVRVMIADGSYTPADAHTWFADVVDAETAGGGYTAGGAAVTGRTLAAGADGTETLSVDAVVFNPASFAARYAIAYVATGDPYTSPLLAYVDFITVRFPAGDPLRVVFSNGLVTIGPPAS